MRATMALAVLGMLTVMALAGPSLAALAPGNGGGAGDDVPITVGGGWVRFGWGGPAIEGGPWAFTNAGPTVLRVTDLACYGDRFRVLDNGAELGETTAATGSGCGGSLDPTVAYADATMSAGCWVLAPGSHSIAVQLTQNPYGLGGAALRVDTPGQDLLAFAGCPVRNLGVVLPQP